MVIYLPPEFTFYQVIKENEFMIHQFSLFPLHDSGITISEYDKAPKVLLTDDHETFGTLFVNNGKSFHEYSANSQKRVKEICSFYNITIDISDGGDFCLSILSDKDEKEYKIGQLLMAIINIYSIAYLQA